MENRIVGQVLKLGATARRAIRPSRVEHAELDQPSAAAADRFDFVRLAARVLEREPAELELALGTGVGAGESAVTWTRFGRASIRELGQRLSIPLEEARRLEAALELGRTMERARHDPSCSVASPEAAFRVLAPEARGRDRERFTALLLDGRHRLLRSHCVAVGTLTTSLVHPREVFGPALREGAAAILVAHNHPSGDPEPSSEDREVTRRLVDVGKLIGIPVLDHLVLGEGKYVSLRLRMGF